MTDNLLIRKCKQSDLEALLHLQEMVYEALPDKSQLRLNTREMLAGCLQAPHTCLGTFDGKELVAIAILYVPNDETEDIAHCINITQRAANLKLVLVDPRFRGLGLQQKLMNMLEQEAVGQHFEVLCCTCSPDNRFSISNVESCGYMFAATQEKYGGLKRNIYYKHLDQCHR